MIAVEVNGRVSEASFLQCRTFEEVIQTVRDDHTPEQVVSSAWWNGTPLSDIDLERDPQRERGTLKIHMRQRQLYVCERLQVADRYVGQILDTFSQSIHAFRTGHSGYGNTFLARGVDELLSFVSWYCTIVQLEQLSDSAEFVESVEVFYRNVREIQQVCERLVQAQMLESSFGIALELEKYLLPLLSGLRETCLTIATQAQEKTQEHAA